MLDVITLFLGILFLYSYPFGWGPPQPSAATTFWHTLGFVALYALLGTLAGLRFSHRSVSDEFLARSVERFLVLHRAVLLGVHLIIVEFYHWPQLVVEKWQLGEAILFDDLVLLSPLLALVALGLVPVKILCHLRRGLFVQYWDLTRFRMAFLVAPVLFLFCAFTLAFDVLRRFSSVWKFLVAYPVIMVALVLVLLVVMFLLSPWILSFFAAGRTLPSSTLAERLNALCARARLRPPQFRLWEIGRLRVANAGVVGLQGRSRVVLLTPALLEHLSEDEVSSVVAHELGHASCGHLVVYLLLAAGSILVMFLADTATQRFLGPAHGGLELVKSALLLGVYWIGLFGFVSRRLELQADLFAARLTEDTRGFVTALERVAHLNGMPRERGGWRHFSVERRVAFLEAAVRNPQVAENFLRRLRAMFLGLAAFLGLLTIGTLSVGAWQAVNAETRWRLIEAEDLEHEAQMAFRKGDFRTAAENFYRASLIDPQNASYRMRWAYVLSVQGNDWLAYGAYRELGDQIAADDPNRQDLWDRLEDLERKWPGLKQTWEEVSRRR